MTSSITNNVERITGINQVIGEERMACSALARCTAPLLIRLNWFGAPRSLLAFLPDISRPFGLTQFCALLNDLGFKIQIQEWDRRSKDLHALPGVAVLINEQADEAFICLREQNGLVQWHDGQQSYATAPLQHGRLLLIENDPFHQSLSQPQTGWLMRLFLTARPEISGLLLVSLVVNLIALVISLFTMFVYNTVIPSGAVDTLQSMAAGACIAILGSWALRMLRVKLISDLSTWAGGQISDIAMRKTLSLSADVSARLGVENNLTRLRSIEGVRQWFGGSSTLNIDFPFVLIFLLIISILGGFIVLVPLVGLMLFALVSWPLASFVQQRSKEVGLVSRQLGDVISIVAHRLRVLRGVRGSHLWGKQLPELMVKSVQANRNYAIASGLVQTIGQALSTLTVLATMGVGIALVLNNSMTTGGLIATMMLIWRVTTPAQQMLAAQVRLRNLSDATQQLDRLLNTPAEQSSPKMTSPIVALSPSIEADRLYYRHSADREPSIANVSFKLEAGSCLAIVGPNGAGKTTLIELLLGLKTPQNGRVLVGGRDIRQFDPEDYRAWLGYLPQQVPGMPVTLREALSLRSLNVSEAELLAVLAQVAGERWYELFGVESADAAFNVQISPWREDRDAIRGRFIVRLAIAVLEKPPLVLLDDPLADRDPALDPCFIRLLAQLRGKTTLIMATHRTDLIEQADQIVVLHEGALVHFGPVAAPAS
ncbi:ATP-binding cassette domain-containing protein [Chitinibacter fontanus]|uniref:ATP-binding cassette domain-containing protein n=1 Tax=Chitinibacter fontanus TaxID=1737446 RepID=A0A7D5VB24_9NEIS|nr:ATP-binding cassette domain-containing protein [Chitinibacter fontanus]QLI82679.1 ATP-binding cassette domain-containing protein [Chitinibacter fontanus]